MAHTFITFIIHILGSPILLCFCVCGSVKDLSKAGGHLVPSAQVWKAVTKLPLLASYGQIREEFVVVLSLDEKHPLPALRLPAGHSKSDRGYRTRSLLPFL